MMSKRKPLPPDTRLSWRDPNMPLMRDYKFGSGVIKHKIDPDYERRYREMLIETSTEPNWRNDPTYNMRKK